MSPRLKRFFPFSAAQTVNIMSEFGPLVTMFVVNAAAGINAGTWALLISTVIAMVVMRKVLGRLPVFPQIASSVTITFGVLTLITQDPMWVQIKVTIFNALFAIFLFGGLYLRKNFFKHVFDRTFHFTQVGWDNFTWSFAWFFVFTAVANEAVRLTFEDGILVFDHYLEGVQVWILFKILLIMPLSGLYAWYLTRAMLKHRLPDPPAGEQGGETQGKSGTVSARNDAAEFAVAPGLRTQPMMVRTPSAE